MKEIILNKVWKTSSNYCKYKALIDDEDFERVNKINWNVHFSHGIPYVESTSKTGKRISLHTFVLGGKIGKQIDHKDGDGLNNQKENLRYVTHGQNQMNRKSHGSSKYLGVSFRITNNIPYYVASIRHNKIQRHFLFKSEIEAALKYNELAIKYHGEFARLNTF